MSESKKKMGSVAAIREFFKKGDESPTMAEMKELREQLPEAEFNDLGQQAALALGAEWAGPAPKAS